MGMIQYADVAIFWHIAMTSFVDPGLPWDALGDWSQHLVIVNICQAAELRGSPHQLTFKLNLLVRDLLWLQKIGTPKSLWICLLPVHQDALLAMRRHSDWSICSFLIRVKRQASKWSTRSLSLNGLVACTAELHFWWRDHSSCSGEVPALPFSVPLSF